MTDKSTMGHTPQEVSMYLRQFILPGNVQEGIDLEVPSWLVAEAIEAIAILEQQAEELKDYKKEVEEVADIMFQFTIRRINAEIGEAETSLDLRSAKPEAMDAAFTKGRG